MKLGAALAQHVLEDSRRLARDVLEDKCFHAGETSGEPDLSDGLRLIERAGQCPAGFSQPSSTGACQSAPTVREPSTHEPSSGCGNLQWISLSWMP